MKQGFSFILFFFFLFSPVFHAAGDVFFFKDDNDNFYFTDTPPDKSYKPFFPKKHKKIRKAYRSGKNLKNNPAVRQHIRTVAKKFAVDPRLIESIIHAESDFDPEAISPAGAIGLMQLMPETAKEMRVKNPRDPFQNISGGTKYFKQMLNTFHGNTRLALAAYNAGPTPVNFYNDIPPFPETRKYVKKVFAHYRKKVKKANRIYRTVLKDGSLLLTDQPSQKDAALGN